MRIIESRRMRPTARSTEIAAVVETVDPGQLRAWVEHLAVPRHFIGQPEQNRATGQWLATVLGELGYRVEHQGYCRNVIARPMVEFQDVILVGAHYDSVPATPGADDNGSALAALLGCATACSRWRTALPIVFVAFNREEDDLLGSRDFVQSYLPRAGFRVKCAHVLEMVGYSSSAPGSQRVPTGLPIEISNSGDFLGLLANRQSGDLLEEVIRDGRAYVPGLAVTGLEVEQGMELFFPVLARSDHVSFWTRELPAVMWTDTSEFRNPHYHLPTDTPNTLDYGFLGRVTQVLTATVLVRAAS